MSRTRRQAWVLLVLIGADAALKVAALAVLPAAQPLPEECALCLVLRVNALGLGSHIQLIMASQGAETIVAGSLFTACLAASLILLAVARRLTRTSLAVAAVTAVALGLSLPRLFPSLSMLPLAAVALASRMSQAILWATIWRLVAAPYWKTGALLFSAAALSNGLSLLYPPYGIVDYLWSSPLNRLIASGVFNMADVFWLAGILVFAVAGLRSFVRALRRSPEEAPPDTPVT